MAKLLTRLWRSFLFSPTALVITLLVLGLTGIYGLLTNSARIENREFSILMQHQVAAGTDDLLRNIGKNTRDYAVWDEFALKVNRAKPDLYWVGQTVDPSTHETLEIDLALLLDPSTHQILYGLCDGQRSTNPQTLTQFAERDWQWMQQAVRHPTNQSQVSAKTLSVSCNGHQSRQLYFMTIHPITNHAGATSANHGKLLMFARQGNPQLLREYARSFHLLAPSISYNTPPPGDLTHYPIKAQDGDTVAYLRWGLQSPGDDLLRILTPGATVLCALLLILGLLLGHQAQRQRARQQSTLRRLERQGDALRSIAQTPHGRANDRHGLQKLCQQLAQTLETARVGIWRHDLDSQKLHCIAGSGSYAEEGWTGARIDADPRYLEQIERERYIALDNLSGSTDSSNDFLAYAQLHGINSFLDTTIRAGKQMHGIISAECRHARSWTLDEINFLCSAADAVALLMESSARQAAEVELASLFYYDPVTGLPNSQRLRMHLDTLTAARRAGTGACALMQLGNLSMITEVYGQNCSEHIIKSVAQRIEALARPGEMAARIGETRFALWLEGETEAEITARLNQLDAALRTPIPLNDTLIHPRFQIGVSLFPGDGHDADTLLTQAASALQSARKLNQQSWGRFNSGQSQAHREQQQLKIDLSTALEGRQLHLHYQPFIDLASRQTSGAEALLRWEHPQKGNIPPSVFISLAEEDSKLINAIGAWVLDQACAQIAQWRHQYSANLNMAINVSVKQMETAGFHHLVATTLARHGLTAAAIELELTESIALSSTPELETNLLELQRLGVPLAIDDFGTGYASFSYLLRFPVSKLKIDRQFFEQVPANPQHSNLVKMMVAMGHAMGADVIGEGVEQIEQATFLQQVGGDFAQGYYFSRPLDPNAMERFLQAQSVTCAQEVK